MAVEFYAPDTQGRQNVDEREQPQALWSFFCQTGLPQAYTLMSHQINHSRNEKKSCKNDDVAVN